VVVVVLLLSEVLASVKALPGGSMAPKTKNEWVLEIRSID